MIIRNITPMPLFHITAHQCSGETGYVYKAFNAISL
jgi:hypothetical protein